MSRFHGSHINAEEHYRQSYKKEETKRMFVVGVLLGLSIGMLWEAIRR